MTVFNILLISLFIILLLGIIYVLQKGFNEVIKAMESIDKRLKKIEDKMKE